MSSGACSHFVQHAWKADICANCLRPRLKHDDNIVDAVSPVQVDEVSSSPNASSVQVGTNLPESSHLSNADAAKPLPVRAKPAVSMKPATPKKPNLTRDQVPIKSDIQQSSEHISSEHLTLLKSKGSVTNNASDSSLTEKELLNSSVGVSDVLDSTDICIASENKCENKAYETTFHHYDLYDVSARELPGMPKQPEVIIGTSDNDNSIGLASEPERRKFQTLPVSAMPVDDVAEEHVAMPYNVVDITIRRPRASDINPLISDSASASNSSPSTGVSTWPSKPQPAKRQIDSRSPPKPRERVTKQKEQAGASVNAEVSSGQDLDSCAKAPAGCSKMGTSDLVSERYAHRIYEEIDDFDVEQPCSKAGEELSRQTPIRLSVGKSPAFEAKMAALASLDLGKTAKQSCTTAPTVIQSEESLSCKTDVASSIHDTIIVPAAKPEKARKSGGKTFFQKLLKFGSKDTSEAVQSSTANRTDEGSMNVIECPDSPSSGRISVEDNVTSSSDAVPTEAAQLTEKQAMLMNLKDCLAKRQTSVGGELGEVSPINSRTRSSESTPLRCPTQSSTSVEQMQERHGSSVEKAQKQTVLDASPGSDSQANVPAIKEQPSSKDIIISASEHTCKEPDVDKGLHRVDKKGNEVQRLEVKDLTVTTEDSGNVDCSVSTCSSDAISPTPSDLSMESSDHASLKRKSRTDRQVGRRRMMEAPPPPPAGAAAVVSAQNMDSVSVTASSRRLSGPSNVASQHPVSIVRHVSVPCDNSRSAAVAPLSHSLPRPASKISDDKLSSDNTQTAPRRAEPAVKHARSKTVSEGVKLDAEHWSEGVGDSRTDEEKVSESSEKRTSKFFNRALPDPPTAPTVQNSSSAQKGSCPEELKNLYELISQSAPAGEMYEDIENCLERSDTAPASSDPAPASISFNDSSSSQSSTSRSSSFRHAAHNPPDDEYLEPVIPPEEEILHPSSWRPAPAPRSSLSSASEGLQTSYVNAEMMSTELPSLADGFAAMTKICQDALRQIAERMMTPYMSASWPSSCHLEWSDFELSDDGQPRLVCQHISYYHARHCTLAPNGCVLMVFKTWPQRPLMAHQHPNVISPLATFRAPDQSSGTSTNFDNIAVLPATSVVDFRQYWQHLHSCSDRGIVERSACLTLARLLSAALHLREHDAEMPRLLPRRIIMTVLDTAECYPLLRPAARISCGRDNLGTFADDVAELVAVMLQLDVVTCGGDAQRRKSDTSLKREKPAGAEIAAAISPQSSYSRCLQRAVRCLHQDGSLWDECVKQSLQLLEFTLWGPSEDEARMIAVSDSRTTALEVWLSVTRCRLLAELAVVEAAAVSQNGLELAERAMFLSSATENGLLEVTKLLFT